MFWAQSTKANVKFLFKWGNVWIISPEYVRRQKRWSIYDLLDVLNDLMKFQVNRKRTTKFELKQCFDTHVTLKFGSESLKDLARHSERGKKTRQTEEEVGRQHQGMDRPGVRQVPEGSGEQGKMEETGCEIICGAPTTLLRWRDRWDDDDVVTLKESNVITGIWTFF